MEIFHWINKQGVESSNGFSVQRISRFESTYCAQDRSIIVSVEAGYKDGKHIIFYSKSSFLAWSSDITEQLQAIKNFRSAITFMGSTPIET
jgi:hypothetical protein